MINLATLTSSQGTKIFGVDADDQSGFSVSDAGDVNGDGYDDLIIGAPYGNGPANASGRPGESYVIFGTETPLATIDLATLGQIGQPKGITIFGANGNHKSGSAVSGAGDINGDGFDDLIIGAARATGRVNNVYGSGEIYVIFGAATLPVTIELSSIGQAGNGVGFFISGIDVLDQFGFSVGGAGDVNGDGFDDLIAGAFAADALGNSKSFAGDSYVIFGSASLSSNVNLLTLGQLGQTGGITIYGVDAEDRSGFAVSGAGDLNGDGFDDIAIGTRFANGPGNTRYWSGESYVVFGGPSLSSTIDLATLGQVGQPVGVTIYGRNESDGSGISLGNAGDVNGDGLDDLIIGARGANSGASRFSAGNSYVLYGGNSFPTVIDLLTLGQIGQARGITILGADFDDGSGYSVSSAGDFNADGFDDLIIGALSADSAANAKLDAGDSYIVFGGASLPNTIDLTTIGEAGQPSGIVIYGVDAGDRGGRSVSSAGDVNGDGFGDVLIGAYKADSLGNAKSNAGESYLIFGGNGFTNSVSAANLGTSSDNIITGTTAAETMVGSGGNDTLFGNGGADVLIGGQGNDILAVSDLSFRRIVGGTGTDTLRLEGSGRTLNLTTRADNNILDIEEIDITGNGSNTLILNQHEVLDISSYKNTLIVRSNSDDFVAFGSGWTQQVNETIGTGFYRVYTQGISTLKIQTIPTNYSILPSFDGYAEDTLLDGSFVKLTNNATDVSILPGPGSAAKRAIFEFDVARFGSGQVFNSAIFEFAANGSGATTPRVFEIRAFAGNGLLTSADAITAGTVLGTTTSVVASIDSGTVYRIPLNTALLQAAAIQQNYLTLQLRMLSGNGLSFPSLESPGWPDSWRPKLIIDVAGPSTSALSVKLGGSLSENALPGTNVGTVTRLNADTTGSLTVLLTSLDTSELQIPVSVTIPAGASSANFALTAVDDQLLDGNQEVSVKATAIGFRDGQASLIVTDYELLMLAFSPNVLNENAGVGSSIGTVTRNVVGGLGQPLTISLSNSHSTKLTVPSSVTIPAGAQSVSFLVDVIDNELVDGNIGVQIAASAIGFATGASILTVLDDDQGRLRPGNIVVSSDTTKIRELRPDGTVVQTFTLPGTNQLRDLVVDAAGRLHVVRGPSSAAVLTTIDVATGSFQDRTFPDWNMNSSVYSGGVATFGQYVFTSDQSSFASPSKGVIRWDTSNNYSAQLFSMDINVYDVVIGLDGLLYARESGAVYVFNPVTMAEIRRVYLGFESNGIAVDAAGNIFASGPGNTIFKYDSNGDVLDHLITDHPVQDMDIAFDGRLVASSREPFDGCYVVMTDTTLKTYTSFRQTTDYSQFVALANLNYSASPRVTTSPTATIYTEGDSVFVDPNLTLTDDGTVIRGATAKIVGGYMPGDTLSYTSSTGISFTGFDLKTGTLSMAGNATPAAYQAALRRVVFQNNLEGPEQGARTIQFGVYDYGWIGSASKLLEVQAINDAPPIAVNNTYSTVVNTLLSIGATETSRLTMTGDPGEWVGQGQSYDVGNGVIGQQYGSVSLVYGGTWYLSFSAQFGQTLSVGRYENATNYGSGKTPQLNVYGNGRQNSFTSGYFDVKEIEYGLGGVLLRFAADFVQHGEGRKPALRGTVAFHATYNTKSGVLGNDTDIDGSKLRVSAYTTPMAGGTVSVYPNGSFSYQPAMNFVGRDQFSYTVTDDQGGQSVGTVIVYVTPTVSTAVLERQVFYNRSTSPFFGSGVGNPVNAIDPSKSALLPGRGATGVNYTNYVLGLNGLIVDIANVSGLITADDLRFAIWDGINVAGFQSTTGATVSVFPNGGVASSTRVKIEFPDNAIRNTWLRVTILSNANTGLAANDVFYFGNAVGDTYTGNVGMPITVRTNATDTSTVRQNQSTSPNSVGISNIYDLNKDGRVNATDTSIVRQNQSASIIRFFNAPPPPSFSESDTELAVDSIMADLSWLDGLNSFSTKRRADRMLR